MTGEQVRDPLSRQLRIAVATEGAAANKLGKPGDQQPPKPTVSPVKIRLGTPVEVLNSSTLPPIAGGIRLPPSRVVAEALLAPGDVRIPQPLPPGQRHEGSDDSSPSEGEPSP